ncbi:hypothetical protein BY996DRAFT_6773639 [Phakopsora pachyrhizi]|nr:hypothetical protein BY996DRAFT_6773639 [Phakopsora pachyrhizi]
MVLKRAETFGVFKQILTGDSLSGSNEVIGLSKKYHGLYATVGCHPCKAYEFESGPIDRELSIRVDDYFNGLEKLIEDDRSSNSNRVVAIGECGLDYDRLSYCSKELQLRYFSPQLKLAKKYKLPLFLHSRTPEAHKDLVKILREFRLTLSVEESLPIRKRGVIHSFTGSMKEMEELVELGYSIGINGCSLKTEENLNVVRAIPLDRLMLETDCPWCEIRPSHASHRFLKDLLNQEVELSRFMIKSVKKERKQQEDEKTKDDDEKGMTMVKGRNEPCTMFQVAYVVSRVKDLSLDDIVVAAWNNTVEMFNVS